MQLTPTMICLRITLSLRWVNFLPVNFLSHNSGRQKFSARARSITNRRFAASIAAAVTFFLNLIFEL